MGRLAHDLAGGEERALGAPEGLLPPPCPPAFLPTARPVAPVVTT